jgi:hypothetical protein
MKSRISTAIALACVLTAGCDLLNPFNSSTGTSTSTPTSPTTTITPTTSITAFAGTWQSALTASTLPVTGCGNVTYTVTPTGTTTANVVFAATCASNISVNGSGSGGLAGNVVTWSASGLVAQGGVNCPFTFTNNTATIDPTTNQIAIAYTGNVCGIPVSGTETVKK